MTPILSKQLKAILQTEVRDSSLPIESIEFSSPDDTSYSMRIKGREDYFSVKVSDNQYYPYVAYYTSVRMMEETIEGGAWGRMLELLRIWLKEFFAELNTELYEERIREFEFGKEIVQISPDFVNTFNQCQVAEVHQLDMIVGMGYRRALEFLVKDYLLFKSIMTQEEVQKIALGNAIGKLPDPFAAEISSLAVKLGNDFTHYHRKMTSKGVHDLKEGLKMIAAIIEREEVYHQEKEIMSEQAKGFLDSW